MKIVSWNVASIRARMPALEAFLKNYNPDIVFLQEIKITQDIFPFHDFQEKRYHAVICGQKSYNGVAILSKEPLSNVKTVLPGFTDPCNAPKISDLLLADPTPDQARFIEATLPNGIHLICVYVPNGNPPMKDPNDTSKLTYKLAWMQALNAHVSDLLKQKHSLILGGDFNVIEKDGDVYNPDAYRDNALMVPPVRDQFETLNRLPLTNTVRSYFPEPGTYSFWDFQMGAWAKNWGMLLDHLFISDDLQDRLINAGIYKEVRGWEKTSDHAPIWCEIE